MAAQTSAIPPPPERDQRIVIYGLAWENYLVLREQCDVPGLRLTYLNGALEIVSPSRAHERKKKSIARLLEMWAIERGVRLNGYGSTTFRKQARERGCEPDECYVLGRELEEFPDLAIEVIETSGGLDKLAVYAGFGVREVWFWQDERFAVHVLVGEAYEQRARSELLPGLDLEQLAAHVRIPDQHDAALAYRDALRAG